jgi:hypothetical protein
MYYISLISMIWYASKITLNQFYFSVDRRNCKLLENKAHKIKKSGFEFKIFHLFISNDKLLLFNVFCLYNIIVFKNNFNSILFFSR